MQWDGGKWVAIWAKRGAWTFWSQARTVREKVMLVSKGQKGTGSTWRGQAPKVHAE